jgi:hypothetical protein
VTLERFFVRITARDRQAFLRLGDMDLDLIVPTARPESRRPSIEALLDQAQIDHLEGLGYAVRVLDPDSARSRAPSQVVELEEWRREMED